MQGLIQRQVFWACLGSIIGVLLVPRGPVALALFVGLTAGAGCLAVLAAGSDQAWLRRQAGALLLLVAFCALGYARESLAVRARAHDPVAGCDGLELDCIGQVLEPGRCKGGKVRFPFRVERVEGRPRLGQFRVLVEVGGPAEFLPEVAPGERWRLTGRLRPLAGAAYPGAFDARAWAAQRGIHHQLRLSPADCDRLAPPEGWDPWQMACRLRLCLLQMLRSHYSQAHRGLLAGILLGETGELPGEVEQDFRAVGLSHLLAASGLNVAIVTSLIFWPGRRLGYSSYRLAWPAAGAVAFYCLLAGASPSIVRATLMALFALLAQALGRRSDGWQTFLLTTLACTLADPGVWSDLGFQLSFAAVLGLLTYGTSLTFAFRNRALNFVSRASSLTLAACLPVTPLLLQSFHQFPPATLPANLLLAPLAEALLPLGFLTSAVICLDSRLAAPLIGLTQLGLDLLITLPRYLATLLPPLSLPSPDLTFWLFYGAGLGLLLRPSRRPLGLVCLVASLVSLTLQVGRVEKTLTIRHACLPQGTVVWLTVDGRHLLIREKARLEAASHELLRNQGVVRPDLEISLDSLEHEQRRLGPLRVISEPSSLLIQAGRLQWGWRRKAAFQLEGIQVQLPTGLWDLERDGPLEVRSDGQTFWFSSWSDQSCGLEQE